jgi:tetraacyldisaccharide 4'-kinase
MQINPAEFRDLVSGRTRGISAFGKRWLLQLAEWPYTLGVVFRNWQFDSGRRKSERVAVPVISVGNLTVGGTGKTPLVQWLAQWFRAHHIRVSIISRGYGAEQGGANDEALELEQKLPDVPHVQNPSRVEAAKIAIEELDTQLILLDDAFQHRQIARDLDIVLVDALEPFGFEHLLPRGTLREPLAGFRRADVVVLTRADVLEAKDRQAIRRRIEAYCPDVVWVEASHAPQIYLASTGAQAPIEAYSNQRVAAFCGIGNPAGFRQTLELCGCDVVAFREFPDHHAYGPADIVSLGEWANELNVSAVLCTCKDLVKIAVPKIGKRALWAVSIGMELLSGQEALEERLTPLVAEALKNTWHADALDGLA